ncbi:MAG: c-type cytochrome [Gemmatimonadetes bacterium]|nr:c-type cytochrome [Gemmatimonadota bacterium]
MGHRTAGAVLAVAALLSGACGGGHKFEPPSRDKQVAQADSLFSPALFDTIAWVSDSARTFEGNNVFAAYCRKCHGFDGRGGQTPYARNRGIVVPSLVSPGWPYGSDIDSVRRRIFEGHSAGMPTWGVAGISPREIDAVAHYILDDLRPEILGTKQ